MENLPSLAQVNFFQDDFTTSFVFGNQLESNLYSQPTILEQLQVTLDLPELVSIYAKEVSKYINFCGLTFSQRDENHCADVVLPNSKPGRHRITFSLAVGENHLGHLIYNINNNLTRQQLSLLESFHKQIVYPFRNAIEHSKIIKLALIDSLTSLGNRCHFEQSIQRWLSHANRHDRGFSLIVLDLDEFKQVNDTYGHLTGDEVLKEFARILQETARGTDMVFRLGGDEFIVLLDGSKRNATQAFTQRIEQQVAENDLLNQFGVSSSIGCAQYQASDTRESLFERADSALYSAKAFGKRCTKIA